MRHGESAPFLCILPTAMLRRAPRAELKPVSASRPIMGMTVVTGGRSMEGLKKGATPKMEAELGGRPGEAAAKSLLRDDDIDVSQAEIEASLRLMEWQELRQRRLSLKLAEPLEAHWRRDLSIASLRMVQGAISLAFFFYAACFGYMVLAMGVAVDLQLVLIFIIFGSPGNFCLMVATLTPRGLPYLRSLTMAGTILHTIGMFLFYLRADQIGLRVPSELLILQVIFSVSLLGLTIVDGALLSFLALLIAPLAARNSTTTVVDQTTSLFFIFGAATLIVMGAYMAEREKRISWLRQILLKQIAERDALTGQLNHGAFFSRADRVIRHADRVKEPVSCLVIDVDHFKLYNDTFGHPAGDACLRGVAAAIASCGRRPLDIVGRLGGEEFALLLFGASHEQAELRAEAVRLAIRELRKPDGSLVTASIGVAHYPPGSGESARSVLSRGDVALYEAKRSGRDRVHIAAAVVAPSHDAASGKSLQAGLAGT